MTCGQCPELVAAVQAKAFDHLRAPLQRIAGFDTPCPYTLEDHYLPDAQRILQGVVETIEY